MRWCWLGFAVLVLLLGPRWALAQDKVYQKSKGELKPTSGQIKEESPKGVQAGKDFILAEDIIDIEYEVVPLTVRTGSYRPARDAEKDFSDPKKISDPKKPKARQEYLAAALKNYQETLKNMNKGQKYAARNIEYRLAILETIQASEAGLSRDKAIDSLTKFVDKHSDGWQITAASHLLGQLLQDAGKFPEAEAAYRKLAEAQVGEKTKQEALLFEAQVTLRSGKTDLALKKLAAFIGKLPSDSPQALRAKVIQGTCFLAGKKDTKDQESKKGLDLLRSVIKETKDPGVKAMAYNTIGEWLLKAEEFKEARWEFLWVDVVYNQDKAEQARALYGLWQTFRNLGDSERAQECFEALMDRQFNGLQYQQQAQREQAQREKQKSP